MSIVRIDAAHVAQVEQLWRRSRYLYQNIGREDLPAMLDRQIALLGEEEGRVWGFLCIQSEERPSTLPATAANRAYIRGVALAQGHAPIQAVPRLLDTATPLLFDRGAHHLLTIYGDQAWLNKALQHAGFHVHERIKFFVLSHLQRWLPSAHVAARVQQCRAEHPTLALRPCSAADLPALAQLDGQTFTPLWHFGVVGLRELLFVGRLQIVTIHHELVGYTAISHHGGDAHLARLAVHPSWQGRGLGHVLLLDALEAVKRAGVQTVMLNTQVDNQRSQQLYRAYDFRATREVVPVLGKQISV